MVLLGETNEEMKVGFMIIPILMILEVGTEYNDE